MASVEEAKDALQDIYAMIRCVKCHEIPKDEVWSLVTCIHKYCKECFGKINKAEMKTCIICDNFEYIEDLIEPDKIGTLLLNKLKILDSHLKKKEEEPASKPAEVSITTKPGTIKINEKEPVKPNGKSQGLFEESDDEDGLWESPLERTNSRKQIILSEDEEEHKNGDANELARAHNYNRIDLDDDDMFGFQAESDCHKSERSNGNKNSDAEKKPGHKPNGIENIVTNSKGTLPRPTGIDLLHSGPIFSGSESEIEVEPDIPKPKFEQRSPMTVSSFDGSVPLQKQKSVEVKMTDEDSPLIIIRAPKKSVPVNNKPSNNMKPPIKLPISKSKAFGFSSSDDEDEELMDIPLTPDHENTPKSKSARRSAATAKLNAIITPGIVKSKEVADPIPDVCKAKEAQNNSYTSVIRRSSRKQSVTPIKSMKKRMDSSSEEEEEIAKIERVLTPVDQDKFKSSARKATVTSESNKTKDKIFDQSSSDEDLMKKSEQTDDGGENPIKSTFLRRRSGQNPVAPKNVDKFLSSTSCSEASDVRIPIIKKKPAVIAVDTDDDSSAPISTVNLADSSQEMDTEDPTAGSDKVVVSTPPPALTQYGSVHANILENSSTSGYAISSDLSSSPGVVFGKPTTRNVNSLTSVRNSRATAAGSKSNTIVPASNTKGKKHVQTPGPGRGRGYLLLQDSSSDEDAGSEGTSGTTPLIHIQPGTVKDSVNIRSPSPPKLTQYENQGTRRSENSEFGAKTVYSRSRSSSPVCFESKPAKSATNANEASKPGPDSHKKSSSNPVRKLVPSRKRDSGRQPPNSGLLRDDSDSEDEDESIVEASGTDNQCHENKKPGSCEKTPLDRHTTSSRMIRKTTTVKTKTEPLSSEPESGAIEAQRKPRTGRLRNTPTSTRSKSTLKKIETNAHKNAPGTRTANSLDHIESDSSSAVDQTSDVEVVRKVPGKRGKQAPLKSTTKQGELKTQGHKKASIEPVAMKRVDYNTKTRRSVPDPDPWDSEDEVLQKDSPIKEKKRMAKQSGSGSETVKPFDPPTAEPTPENQYNSAAVKPGRFSIFKSKNVRDSSDQDAAKTETVGVKLPEKKSAPGAKVKEEPTKKRKSPDQKIAEDKQAAREAPVVPESPRAMAARSRRGRLPTAKFKGSGAILCHIVPVKSENEPASSTTVISPRRASKRTREVEFTAASIRPKRLRRFSSSSSASIAPSVTSETGTKNFAGRKPNAVDHFASPRSSRSSSFRSSSLNSSASSTASFEKRNHKGETPLHIAAKTGNVEKVKQLIAMGADLNGRDNGDWTPLHDAINSKAGNNFIIAKLLCEAGCHVNTKNTKDLGQVTPLHIAAQAGLGEIVELLLSHSAMANIRNKDGRLPRDLARTNEIAKIFDNFKGPIVRQPLEDDDPLFNNTLLFRCLIFFAYDVEEEILEDLTVEFKANITNQLSEDVTHIIFDTESISSKTSGATVPLTLSYLYGVLSGAWLLSSRWIRDSLLRKKLLDPEPYEVVGCNTTGTRLVSGNQVPKKSRINKELGNPGLFSGMLFYIYKNSSFQNWTKKDLAKCIEAADGSVLIREPNPDQVDPLENPTRFHAQDPNHKLNITSHVILFSSGNEPTKKHSLEHVKTLSLDWLIQSALKFKLMDPDNFHST